MRALSLNHFRRRMWIYILLILGGLYWHFGFMPGPVKSLVRDRLPELPWTVDFKRVVYVPFWGFELTGLYVETEDETLLTAQRVRIRTDLLQLPFNGKAVVRLIEFSGLHTTFDLADLEKPDRSNGADAVGTAAKAPRAPSGITAVVTAFAKPKGAQNQEIEDDFGRRELIWEVQNVRFRNSSLMVNRDGETTEILKKLQFDTRLDYFPRIPLHARFRLPMDNSLVDADGSIDLAKMRYDIGVKFKLSQTPPWIEERLPEKFRSVRDLTGRTRIVPGRVELDGVQGMWRDTRWEIGGVIGTREPYDSRLTIAQIASDTSSWQYLYPEFFKKDKLRIDTLKGKLQLQIELAAPLARLGSGLKDLDVIIEDAVLEPAFLKQPVKGIRGRLSLSDTGLNAESIEFAYDGEPYKVKGYWPWGSAGLARVQADHALFGAYAEFDKSGTRTDVRTLRLTSGKSETDFAGHWQAGTPTTAGFTGTASVDLEDLTRVWGVKYNALPKIKPKGRIEAEMEWILDPDLRADLRGRAPMIELLELFRLDDVELDMNWSEKRLRLSYLKANFYDGETRLVGFLDFTEPKNPFFQIHVFMHDARVEKLAKRLDYISDKLSGAMSLDLMLEGRLFDPKTYRGKGNFRILDGFLWSTPLFKELRNLPFLQIEGMENILFRHAEGTFTVSNGRIYSDDAVLSSRLIYIHVNGDVGFDQTLDMNVISRFSPGLIQETLDVGGLAPAVIKVAESKITKYRATGTIKKPVLTEIK